MLGTRRRTDEGGVEGMIEYGILLGTLALGVVLTLVAIGTQIRTVVPDTTPSHIGEP
jgi:Flp pilus assembly pilin Flp